MSGIDDLRQPGSIDIDVTSNNDRVDMSAGIKGMRVIPTNNSSASDRIVADLSTVPVPVEDTRGVEIRESLTKDILEGDNSPFAKYKAEKVKEMEERMAQFDAEQSLAEEEVEEDTDEADIFGFSSSKDGIAYRDSDNEPSISKMKLIDDVTDIVSEEIVKDVEEVLVEKPEDIVAEPIKKEIETPNEDTDIDLSVDSTKVEFEGLNIEEEEDIQEQDNNEILKKLQQLATERLKPVAQQLNLSSFTIVKKPSTNTKLLQEQQVKVAKWVLPNQKSIVLMKEYLGSELESLREFSEDSSSMAQLSRKYHSIYEHIVSPKPATYEAWAKSTPYSDADHYMFAVYIASFKGANFLPADCEDTKCGETFLTDDINIMNMVKFENDEAKKRFMDIYKSETTHENSKGLYSTELIPLSNKIAVVFKEPSIYNLFEIASLDEKFQNKYSSIIEYAPYIDAVYIIDQDNSQLIPVGYKVYADNAVKTVKSKIQMMAKVLTTLTVDEFGPIKAYVRAIGERNEGISYVYPSVTCPKCGKEITEKPATAEELVFTRYQLGALVNTSLK